MTPTAEQPQEQEIELCRGHGNANPRAFLIIDHPQGEDLKTNYALSGATRNTMTGLLRDVGNNIDNFYCTSLLKTPPALTLDQCSEQKKGGGTKAYQEANNALVKAYGKYLIKKLTLLDLICSFALVSYLLISLLVFKEYVSFVVASFFLVLCWVLILRRNIL